MYEKNRLHPITIIYRMIKHFKELVFPFIGLILVGGRPSEWGILTFILISVFLIGFILTCILSWYYFTFYLAEGELRIEYGVFVKKQRYIPFERIQSIDYTEGLLHRPFHLVKVKIETAGSSEEAEAELTAIRKSEAENLKAFITNSLRGFSKEEKDVSIQEEEIIYRITNRQLMVLAATSGGIGVIISAVFAFISQFEDFIPYGMIFSHIRQFVHNGVVLIAMIVFLAFLILWICSLIITVLKFANFTLSKSEKDIIITRGLFEKKQLTIPLERIQAIKISESIIRQPFNLVSLNIISAGGSVVDIEASTVLTIPIVKMKDLGKICEKIVPDYEIDKSITPLPTRALWRYMLRNSWFAIPIAFLLIYNFHGWGLLSLVLFILLPLWGYLKYRSAGYYLSNRQLTLCTRQVDKSTIIMMRNRIQALSCTEGPWQRQSQLGSVYSHVASGSGVAATVVKDMSIEDVQKIYNWYSLK